MSWASAVLWAVYLVTTIGSARAKTVRARGWWLALFLASLAGIITIAWVWNVV